MVVAVKVDKLSHDYDNLKVLSQISFSVNKGEIVAIVGPSGCGKTTLLKILSGILAPSQGSISFFNKDEINKDRSFVFQDSILLPWRTVLENVALPLELTNNIHRDLLSRKYLNKVGFEGFENAFPNELSGGMKQRVNLARALITKPSILLLDEPFSSLDEPTRELLSEELLELWSNKDISPDAILLVTHSITDAVFFADKIIVLSQKPARIKSIIEVSLPHPRKIEIKHSSEYINLVKTLRVEL